MKYQKRIIETNLLDTLQRGKSVILLGARQTGKTTLLKHCCQTKLNYNFAKTRERRQFELDPDSLADEIAAYWQSEKPSSPPLVVIDEVQKVPAILDVAQYLIDENQAQFVLTGSSARKLKKRDEGEINLLPGRVVKLQLDALSLPEITTLPSLENLLLYGSLPHILLEPSDKNKETDLTSYVDIYLEEEIRQEALVRNLGAFSQFLELAAIETGNPVNLTKLSQTIGVQTHLISEYYRILEDCLVVDKIMPISNTTSRRRLTKAPKYLFFDLGVKRICAKEGLRLSQRSLGDLFEQFIGIELNRYLRTQFSHFKLCYWRDHNGPEVDYVIDMHHRYLPIEVKWSDNPNTSDCRHLIKFMEEYPCQPLAYLVCRAPRKRMLTDNIMALPWQYLPEILHKATENQI